MSAELVRIAVISFTENGCLLGERLRQDLEARGCQVKAYLKSRYGLPMGVQAELLGEDTLNHWTEKRFCDSESIIFISACGIAVRSIAPFVKSKQTDPAVVVIDETGAFAVSLLSGHLGGANELTEQAAKILGAQAVITTATDRNKRFAVDVFAKQNNCVIADMKLAKEVSAALLFGEPVGFYSEFPCEGELPKGLVTDWGEDVPRLGVCITLHKDRRPFAQTLYLIPQVLTAGVGCRRGTEAAAIEAVIEKICEQAGIFSEAIGHAASIDLKKNERGLLQYCREHGLAFAVFSAEQLKEVNGNFTGSAFVERVTGVDNVCERAAVLGSAKEEAGALLCGKYAEDGVTAALAQKKWRVKF